MSKTGRKIPGAEWMGALLCCIHGNSINSIDVLHFLKKKVLCRLMSAANSIINTLVL